MNFYISDMHFYHQNIIAFDKRPYKNLEEMHDDMIKKWNSVVNNNDTVYRYCLYFGRFLLEIKCRDMASDTKQTKRTKGSDYRKS